MAGGITALGSSNRLQESCRLRGPPMPLGSISTAAHTCCIHDLLKQLYQGQTATIKTVTNIRTFSIERGVKQGDPLSSFLFNTVFEHVCRQLKPSWLRKKFGIPNRFRAPGSDVQLALRRRRATIRTQPSTVYLRTSRLKTRSGEVWIDAAP